jgi:hypothetical protein
MDAFRIQNHLHITGAILQTAAGDVVMGNSGCCFVKKGTGAATQVTLPARSARGSFAFVKDAKGDAGSNNITIVPDGTANNTTIDGASSLVINVNYGAVQLEHNGTEWSVLDNYPVTNVNAGASGTAGEIDVFPATTSKGKTSITASDNSGNTTTNINTAAQTGARTYTVPDAVQSTSFVMGANAETRPMLGARVRCTTQLDKATNVTAANVVGMSVTLLAGRKYTFKATLFTTSTTNGGMKVGLGGTATATSMIAEGCLWNGATIGTVAQVTALGTVVAATEATTKVEITGEIVVNAGGTFTITNAQNASHADTSSVKVGSFLVVEDVA